MRRWPWLLSCALSAFAVDSRAVPCAANSTIPSHILLVGRAGALADTAAGAFTVVVRDCANNPIDNSTVELRILNCPGVRLSSDSYVPGIAIRCGTLGVTAVTDFHGEVRMTAVGGGIAGGPPGGGACAQFYASGVPLGTATVAYLDLDGHSGMGANDIALWLIDFSLNEPIARSDYDGSGAISANDLSIWLQLWGATGSTESPAAYCP